MFNTDARSKCINYETFAILHRFHIFRNCTNKTKLSHAFEKVHFFVISCKKKYMCHLFFSKKYGSWAIIKVGIKQPTENDNFYLIYNGIHCMLLNTLYVEICLKNCIQPTGCLMHGLSIFEVKICYRVQFFTISYGLYSILTDFLYSTDTIYQAINDCKLHPASFVLNFNYCPWPTTSRKHAIQRSFQSNWCTKGVTWFWTEYMSFITSWTFLKWHLLYIYFYYKYLI